MSVVFAVESMRGIVDEIRPLHAAHWNELPHLRPRGELKPLYERYFNLQSAGCAVLTTARRDGRLIGYCSFFIHTCLWTAKRFATGDLIYLVPEERGGWIIPRLVEYAHELLRHLGVTDARMLAANDNRVGKLLRFAGYKPNGKTEYVRAL